MISVADLITYPLKSGKGMPMESAKVTLLGFANDRCLAIISDRNRILTGREHPKLVLVSAEIHNSKVKFSAPGHGSVMVDIPALGTRLEEVRLFREKIDGKVLSAEANVWISSYLGIDCRFVYKKHSKRNASETGFENLTYVDDSPVHLISNRSLQPINYIQNFSNVQNRFRPNIVLEGNLPFEEDSWREIKIGTMHFKVKSLCERCVFITIDPLTGEKDAHVEPLLTLSKFRKERNEGLTFGIDMIPLNVGTINIGDSVEIIASR